MLLARRALLERFEKVVGSQVKRRRASLVAIKLVTVFSLGCCSRGQLEGGQTDGPARSFDAVSARLANWRHLSVSDGRLASERAPLTSAGRLDLAALLA